MIDKIFVKNLKNLRKAANLTQSNMAENAGISLRYYQRIESGESWPPPATIRSIAHALHTTEAILFKDEKPSTVQDSREKLLAAIVTILPILDRDDLDVLLSQAEAASRIKSNKTPSRGTGTI